MRAHVASGATLLAFEPGEINLRTSIADAAAGRTIAVGTMIASAWLGSAGLLLSRSTAPASTAASISMLMLRPVFLFSDFRPASSIRPRQSHPAGVAEDTGRRRALREPTPAPLRNNLSIPLN